MLVGTSANFRAVLTSVVFTVLVAAPALATPVSVNFSGSGCDTLGATPNSVHELGLGPSSGGPFPTNEELSAFSNPTGQSACGGISNDLITMTNLSGTSWTDVWYVSDPETSISNADGLINGQQAFKIDWVGANTPLVFESLIADGIFQAGETWKFIIDDYVNFLGLPASAFGSCAGGPPCTSGLVGDGSIGDFVSSGSIIVIVPEPTTALLLGGGLLGLAAYARRGKS